MSELVAVSCSDAAVRQAAKLRATRMLEEFGPHFSIHEAEVGDGFVLLAINSNTPWKLVSSAGAVAAIIGFPARSNVNEEAARLVLPGAARTCLQHLCIRLNYGAALRMDVDGSLVCTTDYLGLYPLFVHAGSGLTVCASALPLFRAVPGLKLNANLGAIANSLLLAHYLFGETVYKEVFRIDARTVIEVKKGVVSRHAPASPDRGSAGGRNVIDGFHEVLSDASRELLPHTRATLMSGGLDSRVLSGYLSQTALPSGYRGITMGSSTDFDVQFGAKVIRHLGFECRHIPIEVDHFLEWLAHETLWDGAQSGGYVIHLWGAARDEALAAGPVATGLFGDAMVGAKRLDSAFDARYADYSFDTLFAADNEWGVPDRIVRKLLRDPEALERLDQCHGRLRDEFDSYGSEPWKNVWWFHALHRQRFLIGRFAKLLSYRSWPVMPFIDYRVREYFDALPLECVRDRGLEFGVVLQKFPALARLPLDRGDTDTRSVVSGLKPTRLPWVLQQCIGAIGQSIKKRIDGVDHGFHDRMYDMNAAGWRVARTAFADVIELASARIHAPFARQMLVERDSPTGPAAINVGSGRKAVMSAICWIAMQEAPEALTDIVERRGHRAA